MKIEQRRRARDGGWQPSAPPELAAAQLVLVFGAPEALSGGVLEAIAGDYPEAFLAGCSTAGEIAGTQVFDGSVVSTAVQFEHTRIVAAELDLTQASDSRDAGSRLAARLPSDGLQHVVVLSDGLNVNGSELVRGLVDRLPPDIQVTGGLAGDGERFESTLVFLGPEPRSHRVVAFGFYGERFAVGYGSLGGWDPFGPERLITRSSGNVLMELDGRSALGLYKKYLGHYAAELPASALLFPLSLRSPNGDSGVVRTIQSIDEERDCMSFAGDVPEGYYARLMKANFERLIDGATLAARASSEVIGSSTPELALLISCVGRKMVLRQRVEEEVESVREIFGDRTVLTGFYSYGEISPFTPSATCELHNQTMTITTFSES